MHPTKPSVPFPQSTLAAVFVTIVLAMTLVAPAAAQSASYTYLGPPLGNGTTPSLTALNLPRIGSTFRVQVSATGPTFTQSLLIGVANPSLQVRGLGTLFSSGEVVIPVTPSPATIVSFQIPNAPALVGSQFFQQVLTVSVIFPCQLPVLCNGYPRPWLGRGGHGVVGR